MKKTSRIISMILALLLLFASFPAIIGAEGEPTLTAAFANDVRGDGEGTLTATGLDAGTYKLYFVNGSGVLPGYEEIAQATTSTGSVTFELPRAFLLPPAATGIALRSGSETVAVYTIPEEKRITDDDYNFSFASVSDVHMNLDDPSVNYGASPKWTAALNFFDEMEMDAVIISGDLTGSGTETEYERYRAAVEASTYPAEKIYEAQGNHDATQVARFLTYTQGEDDVHPFEGSAWFYVLKEGENGARDNLFIFMAQELTGTSGTPTSDNFSSKQLDWVENLLQTYAGTETNIFLIEHSMIRNFGPGDKYGGAYVEPMYFYDQFPGNIRFKSLLTEYKEIIMMSGHTHLSLREGYNFGDEDGTAARMIHNSSISQPRCYTSSGSISYNSEGRTTSTEGSEGYLVYVFDECVAYVGYDLTGQHVIPTASYLIPLYSEDRSAAQSISVTVQPTKTEYTAGDWFDGRGMVVTATYADDSTAEVKGWNCSIAGGLSKTDTSVSITYGSCAPVTVPITVNAAPSPHGEGYFEGSGTAEDPFLISTPADFAYLTDLMNACTNSADPCGNGFFYKQTADIDMTGYEGYDGTHVLNDSRKTYFGGVYDGAGHTLTVNLETEGQTAVFPYITAAILNLKITGSITSPTGTTGSGTAQPIRTMQAGSIIANCVFEMTLSGAVANGVCYSSYGTMFNVYVTGVAKKAVYTTNSGGKYYHVYTNMEDASGSPLTHSTTTASSDLDAIAAAFNNREDDAYLSGVAALTAVSPALSGNSLGQVSVENGTIVLKEGTYEEIPVISGSGTVDDPFIIDTPDAFKALTDFMNASTSSSAAYGAGQFFLQTADIDMTGYEGYDGTHVLNDSRKTYFGGIYDGNGHTITVNIETEGQTAVFPYITGALINLKIVGSITSPTGSSGSGTAQPVRAVQAGAVLANCVFEMTLSAAIANGVTYSLYGTVFNVYTTGVATKAVYTTNTGNCYNVFNNVKNASGTTLTHSKTTSTDDLDVIAAAFNDRESASFASGVAALTAVNPDLDADSLGTAFIKEGHLFITYGKLGAPAIPGSGTADDPYLIGTPKAFMALTDYMNDATSSSAAYGAGQFFLQTADIDMTGYEGYDGTHVLNDSRKTYFGGVYNGDGHTITVDIDTTGQTAVFPYITGAILNLKIVGSITSPTSSSGSGTAQPVRAVQAGAVIANCVFEMTLSAAIANGVTYSLYGTVFNVYTTGVATKAVYTTNTGSCYNVFNNVKNASGTTLTHSKTTSTDDLDVVAAAFNDRTSAAFTSGVAALTAVNPLLTADSVLPVHSEENALVFGAAESDVFTLGVYDKAFTAAENGVNSVTILGTLTCTSLDVLDVDYLKLTLEFTDDTGEVVKTKVAKIRRIFTTITGCASTSQETATAQGTDYIDATYLYGVTVAGVPAGSYGVNVTVEAIFEGEPVCSASTASSIGFEF